MPVVDTALGAAARIGPYFSVVSFVPAALFTAAVVPLLAARPWTGEPHWSQALDTLSHPTFVQFAILFALVMFIALALHPLQYALIQVMEGYWGVGSLALRLARTRLRHHLGRLDSLLDRSSSALKDAETLQRGSGYRPQDDLPEMWAHHEANRLRRRYPGNRDDVMPTLLGNVLRRYENQAGRPYNLDIIAAAPHLLLVANPDDAAYVRDQRTQLDLATRLSASCFVLTGISAVLLAPCGWWMLLAAVPYLIGQMFYRGACTVAQEYGVSLQTLLDLNRHKLYERLGVPAPRTLDAEREQNEVLSQILSQRSKEQMRLVLPPPKP